MTSVRRSPAGRFGRQERIRQLEEELREVKETLDAIRKGEIDAIVVTDRDGTDKIYSVEGPEQPYRVLIEEMSEGAATISRTGRILYANRCLSEMLGRSLQDLLGSPVADCFASAGDAGRFQNLLTRVNAEPLRDEFLFRSASGDAIPVQTSLNKVPIDPNIVGVVVTDLREVRRVEDKLRQAHEELRKANDRLERQVETRTEALRLEIAERRQAEMALRASDRQLRTLNEELEERVRDRTAQLESTIRELESFSYSISHDLRAPLRAINSFAQIVLEESGPKLGEQAQHDLRIVVDNARMMGRLVDDLLAFSRLGRQEFTVAEINTVALVRAVADDLLAAEPAGRKVNIAIAPMPAVVANQSTIRQVWVNLLANALKFTRSNPQAAIEVGSYRKDGFETFFVRDNGIGFDMQYSEKIFGVFERLPQQEDIEGTGMGLALVRRIVERHGGAVCADAVPGEGATFYFTIPVAP